MRTYSAYYEETGDVIYQKKPAGNLFGELPIGTFPVFNDPRSTRDRRKGDPWEFCVLVSRTGRKIIVKADDVPAPVCSANSAN